jgi:serine/threonine-protein kinase
LSLTKKILLFTALLIVLLVGATVLYTTYQANALARENIDRRLDDSRSVWSGFQSDRLSKLNLGVRTLGNDPYFKALMEQTEEADTILDTLQERGADLASDFFISTDPQGLLVARSDKPTERGTDLAKDPVVAMSLNSEEAAGLWREGNRLYHAVSVPMLTRDTLFGVLLAGYELNESVMKSLRRLAGAEIALVVDGQLSTSTFGPAQPALAAALAGRGALPDNEVFDLQVGAESYRGLAQPLEDAAHRRVGSLVALASLEQETAPFVRFRNSLLLVGLLVAVIGLLGAQVIARRITEPISILVDRVKKARDGSFAGAIPIQSNDEVGTLAKAFNGLLTELREKEQLIDFLHTAQSTGTLAMPTGVSGVTGMQSPGGVTMAQGMKTTSGLTIAPGMDFAERYKIQEVLGRGGMGVVFRAHDRQLDETVALKTLRPDVVQSDPTLLPRFKQEIKLARKITHKNVLRTHDFGEFQATPYISMEYLEGVTLKDLIKRKGALPMGVGYQVAKQMCHGLSAAHAEGVIHRDIKPQNMLILPESGDLKVMDFGIARVSNMKEETPADSGLTGAGMVMGTPDYLPPELGRGQAADFRSDLYSLGVVIFEVFTGQLPFDGGTPMQTIIHHIQTPPPAPRSINPAISPELETVILRCLEKDPARRFQKVDELAAALSSLSERAAA